MAVQHWFTWLSPAWLLCFALAGSGCTARGNLPGNGSLAGDAVLDQSGDVGVDVSDNGDAKYPGYDVIKNDTGTKTDTGVSADTAIVGTWQQVSCGSTHSCGVRSDGTIGCWGAGKTVGPPSALGPVVPPSGAFSAVSTGGMFTCAIRTDATLACWGNDLYAMGFLDPPSGSFESLGAGAWHACAVRNDGSPACWGSNGYGRATPP